VRNPTITTITGLDEKTDLVRVRELSHAYPLVEWGVLFSRKLMGIGRRYPSSETFQRIRLMKEEANHVSLSVHLCGAVGRQVLDGTLPEDVDWSLYDRFQVNAVQSDIDRNLANVRRVSRQTSCEPIVQWRHDFWPEETTLMPLFDRSGGRGEVPTSWPEPPVDERYMVGFAGGLSPDNVVREIERMNCNGVYWIDMETGVRDEEDFLDLDKVERVLRQVYGWAAKLLSAESVAGSSRLTLTSTPSAPSPARTAAIIRPWSVRPAASWSTRSCLIRTRK
jgi:phosphoribosylanthranilate isomerase